MACSWLSGDPLSGGTYTLVQHARRLESGADASLQDADGQTPLDKAVAQVGSALLTLILKVISWLGMSFVYCCCLSRVGIQQSQATYASSCIQGHARVIYLLRRHALKSHR